MNNIPNYMNVNNKHMFSQIHNEKMTSLFREHIVLHMLKGEENDYFDTDKWCREYLDNNCEQMEIILEKIIDELTMLNWKCKLSFGGTGLFIYSSDTQPPSCFDDNF